jgi:hypothetical protein
MQLTRGLHAHRSAEPSTPSSYIIQHRDLVMSGGLTPKYFDWAPIGRYCTDFAQQMPF